MEDGGEISKKEIMPSGSEKNTCTFIDLKASEGW
jgi:hypothetical protein